MVVLRTECSFDAHKPWFPAGRTITTIRIKLRMLSTAVHRLPSSSIWATNVWDGVRLLRQVETFVPSPFVDTVKNREVLPGRFFFFFFLTFVALLRLLFDKSVPFSILLLSSSLVGSSRLSSTWLWDGRVSFVIGRC